MSLVEVSLEELRRLIDEVLESDVKDLSKVYIRALGSGGRPWIIVRKYRVHERGGCYEHIVS